jgi:N-acetylneuraminate lyase
MKKLTGLYPALVTPYTAAGELDRDVLARLVERLIEQGVDGFYVCGSTGECFLLDETERMQALETVVTTNRGRAAVIAQVGSTSTRQSVRLAAHAAEVGADAVSSVSPFYYKYSFAALLSHYRAIMDAVALPMLVYNFPALSGVNFAMEHFSRFAEDPRIIGIKHTSYDLFQLERIHSQIPRFVLFNGHEEVFLAGMSMGASGAIGATFNIMTEKFSRIQRLFKANRMAEALVEQSSANTVVAALLEAGIFAGIKYLLGKQGLDCHGCRMPMEQVSPEQQVKLDAVFDALKPLARD